jgi:hypothetical protein
MIDINIKISDIEQNILESRMLDVEEWLRGVVVNNIRTVESQLIDEWLPRLDYPNVPGGKEGLIIHILHHPDYKSREELELA